MGAISVQVPYPVFYDRDGQPLDNGNIYIGVANLDPIANPLQVYYDEALTLLASQPLKTSNGYIYRNGTPAQLYVDANDFSIIVNESNNTLVYSFPQATGIGVQASDISKDGGGTVQDFIDLPTADLMVATVLEVGENYKFSNVTPGDPNGALFVQNLTPKRRTEIQLAPLYTASGAYDIAGAEYTLWGRDPKTGPGTTDNTSFTIRSRCNTTTGAVESWDFFSFKIGTDTDAPMRWGNDAFGYTMELSASTGKLNAIRGIRAGDGIGGFGPSNNVPLFAAAGDQPAYDWEERTSDGVTLLYNWRARLVGGNWSLYNITAGTVPFQITGAGRVLAPYVDTKITTGGNYTPNLWMDSTDGQIYRTGWSKVTANANATDLASAISLVNQIKATLIAYGIMQ